MRNGTNYYELSLPAELSTDAFENLMVNEIFPLVNRGPNRVGSISGLSLFRNLEGGRRYIFAVDWEGLRLYEGFLTAAFEALADHKIDVLVA